MYLSIFFLIYKFIMYWCIITFNEFHLKMVTIVRWMKLFHFKQYLSFIWYDQLDFDFVDEWQFLLLFQSYFMTSYSEPLIFIISQELDWLSNSLLIFFFHCHIWYIQFYLVWFNIPICGVVVLTKLYAIFAVNFYVLLLFQYC